MHISDGILSSAVLLGGAGVAAAGVAIGLKKTDHENIPHVAVLSAAFFVASLIHVPVGPASAHLVLNGLMGLILGWAVFPAVAVGLLLQVILLGAGGVTVLGVNTAVMAVPGVLCRLLFVRLLREPSPRKSFAAGFAAGAFGIAAGGILTAALLVTAGSSFHNTAIVLLAAHVPVLIVEGLVTGSTVMFLQQVRPGLFGGDERKETVDVSA